MLSVTKFFRGTHSFFVLISKLTFPKGGRQFIAENILISRCRKKIVVSARCYVLFANVLHIKYKKSWNHAAYHQREQLQANQISIRRAQKKQGKNTHQCPGSFASVDKKAKKNYLRKCTCANVIGTFFNRKTKNTKS